MFPPLLNFPIAFSSGNEVFMHSPSSKTSTTTIDMMTSHIYSPSSTPSPEIQIHTSDHNLGISSWLSLQQPKFNSWIPERAGLSVCAVPLHLFPLAPFQLSQFLRLS